MLEIEKAGPDKHPIIQDLAQKTWPDTFKEILSEKQIAYMLNMMYSLDSLKEQSEKASVFLLIKENGNYLGFSAYEFHYKGTQETKIHKIYILPSAQGKGAGKLLMDKISQEALSNKDQYLILNVNRFNKALNFYKYYGFEIIAEENIDIGNGYLMEDFVLKKSLY